MSALSFEYQIDFDYLASWAAKKFIDRPLWFNLEKADQYPKYIKWRITSNKYQDRDLGYLDISCSPDAPGITAVFFSGLGFKSLVPHELWDDLNKEYLGTVNYFITTLEDDFQIKNTKSKSNREDKKRKSKKQKTIIPPDKWKRAEDRRKWFFIRDKFIDPQLYLDPTYEGDEAKIIKWLRDEIRNSSEVLPYGIDTLRKIVRCYVQGNLREDL